MVPVGKGLWPHGQMKIQTKGMDLNPLWSLVMAADGRHQVVVWLEPLVSIYVHRYSVPHSLLYCTYLCTCNLPEGTYLLLKVS